MTDEPRKAGVQRKPPWLRVKVGHGPDFARVSGLIHSGQLHTVCEEAMCPNQGTCWQHGRATIMILGDACTRHCAFCNVRKDHSGPCDPDEPRRVAEAIREMKLTDVVITSVTRDDLPDGGAAVWAETIRRTREAAPGILIEVLVPDFGGDRGSLDAVLDARPDVFGHNLEMVKSLYGRIRPGADYDRSLQVLARAREKGFIVKTGIMVGVGETKEEMGPLLRDARDAGCEILYVGQYLQPSREHWPVARYVEPVEFYEYRITALTMGFPVVVSGPLVRSSFHSEEQSAHVRNRLGR